MATTDREEELLDAYVAASPLLDGALTVLTDRSAVEARARDLRAKLAGLGVTDVSAEGERVFVLSPVSVLIEDAAPRRRTSRSYGRRGAVTAISRATTEPSRLTRSTRCSTL